MNAHTTFPMREMQLVERQAGLSQKRRLFVQSLFALIDTAVVYAAFALACLFYGIPLSHRTMDFAVLLPPICVAISLVSGGYDPPALVRPLVSAARGVRSVVYGSGVLIIILFAAKASGDVSRIASILGFAMAASGVFASRMVLTVQVRREAGGEVERIVLIEDGRTCPGLAWARRLDARTMGITPDADDPAMLDRIGTLAHRMDRIVVACRPERRADWAAVLKGFDAKGEIVDESVDALGVIGAGRAGRHGTLIVAAHPMAIHHRLIKRGFDIAFAAMAVLLAAPVLIAVTLAILIEDGRPVFFHQQRVGQGNRTFSMLKFRSMSVARCDAAAIQLTRRGDARVTRVGRFIRAASLDELPQLINVLTGRMSIVGPRPHAAMAKAGDKLYWQVDRRYWERHAVKPGLTGLAQVRGFRGATDHERDLRDRLQADLEYREGWSIWRDIRIVAATARVMVHPQAF